MHSYCTLFDSGYLVRGLAMYESLKEHTNNFHLFIFAFDDRCFDLLNKLNLDFVTVISLNEFEDDELLRAKKDRSVGEYCWTCTPSTIKYCIDTYHLDSCTYLDADLYFFGDPSVLIDEMGSKSVLITEHRYTKRYDQSETSGIYCVQFMTFKNNDKGMKVLEWWRNACNSWCYARFEDGKFGDQKYLDDWLIKFDGVHSLKNLGGGVAPWNIQQYDTSRENINLIFYHFHNLKFINENKVDLGNYTLRESDIKIIYKPHLAHLYSIISRLAEMDSTFDFYNVNRSRKNWKTPITNIKRRLTGEYNIYHKDYILGL